jgi:hypothetical protein
MQRPVIEETLNALSSTRAKLTYLRALQARYVTVEGAWSTGSAPFVPNDPVSDRLIRLEERWLRLDG